MAKYHGNKGSMTYAGSAVAELLAWRITGMEVPVADVSVKGDTHKTFDGSGPMDPGIITAEVYLDLDATGQGAWAASVLAGTGTAVAFVVLTDTAKDMTFNAIPTGLEMDSPEGDTSISRATFTGKITGTVVDSWV